MWQKQYLNRHVIGEEIVAQSQNLEQLNRMRTCTEDAMNEIIQLLFEQQKIDQSSTVVIRMWDKEDFLAWLDGKQKVVEHRNFRIL
jgi:hypothetical protein